MLAHYASTAFRNFLRFRTTSLVCVLSLALGLFCFVAAVAAVQYIRASDLHWQTADRVVLISQRMRTKDGNVDTGTRTSTSGPLAKYLRLQVPQLEAVAAVRDIPINIAVSTGERNATVKGIAAEPEFLRIFPFSFIAGSHQSALQPGSVILTRQLAEQLFGSEVAVGRTLVLEGEVDARVSGVIDDIPKPSHFGSGLSSVVRFELILSDDVVATLTRRAFGRSVYDVPETIQWNGFQGHTYALLPEGGQVTGQDLNAALRDFGQRNVPKETLEHKDYFFGAIPIADVWATKFDELTIRRAGVSLTTILQILAGLVLTMSCLNYANAVAAKAAARMKETGMRAVLGARRRDTVFQFVLEAGAATSIALIIALGFLAAAAGVLSYGYGIQVAILLQNPLGVGAFLVMLMVAVSLLAGIYPGMLLATTHPLEALRSGRSGLGSSMLPKILVGVQFGAASILLVALAVIQLQNLELRKKGLQPETDPVVAIGNSLQVAKVNLEVLRSELLAHSAIKSVSALSTMPWAGNVGTEPIVLSTADSVGLNPVIYSVSQDFLRTLGITLLAGRSFDASRADDAVERPDPNRTYSIIVDRAAAMKLGWENPEEAVDKVVYSPISRTGAAHDQPLRIIGVTENKALLVSAPVSGIDSFVYMFVPGAGYPLVRIDGTNVTSALAAIDTVWRSQAPDFPVNRHFMNDLFEQTYGTYQRLNQVISLLTLAAFVIAAMGLFGMASFVASRRIHEVGVRKTLGASGMSVTWMLLKEFSKPVVLANLAIWPVAYLTAQAYLAVFVDRISLGLTPFIASLAITLVIAWIAVAGQTLRAARLNPATVLRYE